MHTGNTARQKSRSAPRRKEKLRVLTIKVTSLRRISHTFLALGLVQNSYQSDVGWPGFWMPGGVEDRHQEASPEFFRG